MRCWGEDPELLSCDDTEKDEQPQGNDDICKMNLFCSRGGRECIDEGNVAAKVETVRF